MPTDYILSARNIRADDFGTAPGAVKFLATPGSATRPRPEHEINVTDWIEQVMAKAIRSNTGDLSTGDIVVYVHGYNSDPELVLTRHRQIRQGLLRAGFDGAIVTFDWPSGNSALNYQDDRQDARATADRLVNDVILRFSRHQRPDCRINTHILAHSMGAYVVREAFDYADQSMRIRQENWSVSQVAFIAADVSVKSMGVENGKSDTLYRRCVRLTNYYNPFDDILSLSNVKQIGAQPRAGRNGLPATAPDKAVDVYCGARFAVARKSVTPGPSLSHAWYFEDPLFFDDLFQTIEGRIDRREFTTRAPTDKGGIALRPKM